MKWSLPLTHRGPRAPVIASTDGHAERSELNRRYSLLRTGAPSTMSAETDAADLSTAWASAAEAPTVVDPITCSF